MGFLPLLFQILLLFIQFVCLFTHARNKIADESRTRHYTPNRPPGTARILARAHLRIRQQPKPVLRRFANRASSLMAKRAVR